MIQQHGKPVYLKSFGIQAVGTRIPMTSDTIFALHSNPGFSTASNKMFAERIAMLPLARQPGTLWRYGHLAYDAFATDE